MKLNLGCGQDYKNGWINWDISKKVKADIYLDVRISQFPAPDNSFEEIYCSGMLEQILENEHFLHVMNECWRILKEKGIMTIIVPSSRYSIAFRDPFDCRHFTEETWNYLNKESDYYKKYGSIYGFKPWNLNLINTNEKGIMIIQLQK